MAIEFWAKRLATHQPHLLGWPLVAPCYAVAQRREATTQLEARALCSTHGHEAVLSIGRASWPTPSYRHTLGEQLPSPPTRGSCRDTRRFISITVRMRVSLRYGRALWPCDTGVNSHLRLRLSVTETLKIARQI